MWGSDAFSVAGWQLNLHKVFRMQCAMISKYSSEYAILTKPVLGITLLECDVHRVSRSQNSLAFTYLMTELLVSIFHFDGVTLLYVFCGNISVTSHMLFTK